MYHLYITKFHSVYFNSWEFCGFLPFSFDENNLCYYDMSKSLTFSKGSKILFVEKKSKKRR